MEDLTEFTKCQKMVDIWKNMVIAGKEDFGNNLSNFGKNFCGLGS